jgi:hypothetical protein
MSYEVSLYDRAYLLDALANGLGDWSASPSLRPDAVETVIRTAMSFGFIAVSHPPGFIEYLLAQGVIPSRSYVLNNHQYSAELQIYRGSVVFLVSSDFPEKCNASVELVRKIGSHVAGELDLGFIDPQSGEAF